MRTPALTGPSQVGGSTASAVMRARELREHAYAPYSDYQVGAFLLTEDGGYPGVNIEVSGRSTSIHAEMMAAYNAVMNGATEFRLLALSHAGEEAPCGLCQHTLAQFCEDLEIIVDLHEDEDEAEGETPTAGSRSMPAPKFRSYSLDELIGDGYAPASRQANRDAMSEFTGAD